MIMDKGRRPDEMAVVVIENGSYLGYGFIDRDETIESPAQFKEYIQRADDNRDAKVIITNCLRTKKYKKIVPY